MARTDDLLRDEVCAALQAWGAGAMSDAEMHLWATNNYFPAHQAVAPGEPNHVALSIGVVLTELECTNPPYSFGREAAAAAIDLINAPRSKFDECKRQFYQAIEPRTNAL